MFAEWMAFLCSCFTSQEYGRPVSSFQGVERELKLCYQQPHLVLPMKLVFYDSLPATPAPRPQSQVSRWISQGKDLASRASVGASLVVRKRTSSRPPIGPPQHFRKVEDVPLRRLELSIYMPGNRLSALPGFEDIDFTNSGEIRRPERSLKRVKSETVISLSPTSAVQRKPTTSMVGDRQLDYWQKPMTIIATSRPSSWHDALHSHPVNKETLLDMPDMNTEHIRKQDTIPRSPSLTNGRPSTAIDFPSIQEEPMPASSQGASPLKQSRPQTSRSYHSYTNSSNRNRVSRWLRRTSSTDTNVTLASTFTSTSISSTPQTHIQTQAQTQAHQLRRSHLYQCTTTVPSTSKGTLSLPHDPVHCQTHSRKHAKSVSTVSSSSTVPSASTSESVSTCSMTTLTTALTLHDPRSRSGTVRSGGKMVEVVDEEMPAFPAQTILAKDGVDTQVTPIDGWRGGSTFDLKGVGLAL